MGGSDEIWVVAMRIARHLIDRLGRSGMTGLVAAAMFMLGGGMGLAVAVSTSAAGAATSHSTLPPVNVSVSNTPNVNVANLPVNGQGRLRVQSHASTSYMNQQGPWYQIWSNGSPQWITITNVGGRGVFKGFTYNVGDNCSCNWLDGYVQVIVDGNVVFGSPLNWLGWPQGTNGYGGPSARQGASWYNVPGVIGGSLFPGGNQYIQGYYMPPNGIPFSRSLVVQISPYWWGPQHLYNIWMVSYYSMEN